MWVGGAGLFSGMFRVLLDFFERLDEALWSVTAHHCPGLVVEMVSDRLGQIYGQTWKYINRA